MEPNESLHPAAAWALDNHFTPDEVACTTAVVLKILDGKCKMLPGEKTAVLAIYDTIHTQAATLFDAETYRLIAASRGGDADVAQVIHELRLYAEALIPKPVMKAYKARLRDGLFG
jgi:hypothetical protein